MTVSQYDDIIIKYIYLFIDIMNIGKTIYRYYSGVSMQCILIYRHFAMSCSWSAWWFKCQGI